MPEYFLEDTLVQLPWGGIRNNVFEKETLKPEMRPHAVYFKQNIGTEMFSFGERNLGKVKWDYDFLDI